jgi:hypothetical protein
MSSNWRSFFQADPEKVMQTMTRDLATSAIAIIQVVKGRKLRVMGSWTKDLSDSDKRLLFLGHQGMNYCQFMLVSYFIPVFAEYWYLRDENAKVSAWRTIYDLHRALQDFRGIFELYRAIHEAFATIFDMKFDQYHTIATMLGLPIIHEDGEPMQDGVTWIGADSEELEKRRKSYHAARDRAKQMGISFEGVGDYPDFEQSVEIAKNNYRKIIELDPIVSDFDKFLAEELRVLKKKPSKDDIKDLEKELEATKKELESLRDNDDKEQESESDSGVEVVIPDDVAD